MKSYLTKISTRFRCNNFVEFEKEKNTIARRWPWRTRRANRHDHDGSTLGPNLIFKLFKFQNDKQLFKNANIIDENSDAMPKIISNAMCF